MALPPLPGDKAGKRIAFFGAILYAWALLYVWKGIPLLQNDVLKAELAAAVQRTKMQFENESRKRSDVIREELLAEMRRWTADQRMAYQAERDQYARSLVRRHASNCIQLLQRDILTAQIAGVVQRADQAFALQSGALDKELSEKQKRFASAAEAIQEKMKREPITTSRLSVKLFGIPSELGNWCECGSITIEAPAGRLKTLEGIATDKRIELKQRWKTCVCAVILGILATAFGLRSWRSFSPAGVSTRIQA